MRVGFSTPGASSWYVGSVFLKAAGLDPERDVQYISLGGDPAVIYTALRTGRVDAFVAWEPTTTRVIEEGIAYPLTRLWEETEHRRWLGAPKAQSMFLITREEVIVRNPGVVARLVAAHKRALELIRGWRAQEIVDAVLRSPKGAEVFSGLERSLLVKMIERIKPGFGTGCLSKVGFDVEMKIAVDYGVVRQPVSFEEFAETRFAGRCLD
jgi:ABC-type nitrate/sulfonate/bicarbonate transport system substrate-binding protein